MPNLQIFKFAEMPFKPAITPTGNTSIARIINADFSAHMGAGVERLENTTIEWTVTYDEVLFIFDGSLTIESEGKRHICSRGDVIWLPNGTTLKYIASAAVTYFYALYPVDWARQQGTKEP